MALKKQKKTTGSRTVKVQATAGKSRTSAVTSRKIVLTTLSLGAIGVLGYLGWQYMKSRKAKRGANLDDTLLQNTGGGRAGTYPSGVIIDPLTPGTSRPIQDRIDIPSVSIPAGGGKSTKSTDEFPIKKGSKGENVRRLQEALIRKYGNATLPKYGADGDFGTETTNALKKLKMPLSISETFFNVLTQGSESTAGSSSDISNLASKIYNATIRRDFSAVLSLLKNIKSSTDYSTVSEGFKQFRLAGVRKTLVTGLLDTFSSSTQKQQLRLAFATMGLTYDGNKWSLSGIDGIPILTVVPAKVWINATTAVTVPPHMILGNEVARRLQYVLFINNGRYFLVHSNCIKHL
ncbi:peptidoglycan-binding domain-containing protein [Chitinophaga agri]|uniref:Peptidoglycan binding-like domain-containing protein n=1 Tax=Chitinophaga agri TaxID=2703787 RepID=A0A6B9ZJP3_9BACT|nr:hypothetical protein [Chitinophaga agri]QHS60833.1 hypothetical protein GWR21_14880 [Chitinophaga agri]